MPTLAQVIKKIMPRPERPSAKTLAFLAKHRVPALVTKALASCTYDRAISLGALTLNRFANLPKANGGANRHALKNGYLIVGSGPNGDPVAVELKTGKVAFLAHEILWGFDPETNGFEECVARTKLDMATFFARASTRSDFPCDFYEARGE